MAIADYSPAPSALHGSQRGLVVSFYTDHGNKEVLGLILKLCFLVGIFLYMIPVFTTKYKKVMLIKVILMTVENLGQFDVVQLEREGRQSANGHTAAHSSES